MHIYYNQNEKNKFDRQHEEGSITQLPGIPYEINSQLVRRSNYYFITNTHMIMIPIATQQI